MAWNLLVKRRDDLPEMRWPLVILTMLAASFFGGSAVSFQEKAAILTVPFLVLAVVAYTLLILLWRRLAALAVTAGIGAVVLASGGGWFAAVGCAVSILAVSYVYAALFLGREPRFVRIASTASAVGVCLLLTGVAWISWRFGTIGAAIEYACDLYRDAVSTGFQTLYGIGGTGEDGVRYVLLPETVDAMLYQAVAAVPALTGMMCILFAGLCDGGIRFLFWLLDCGEYFSAEADQGITIPRSFGVLYGVLLFLVMSTSSTTAPYLYSILSNCHWIFALPCAWVGLSVGFRKLRESMAEASFYGRPRSHSPVFPILITVCFFLFLGLSTAFTLSAVLGAVFIITRRREEEPQDDAS
ncbi:MAG: hypothetical protein IJ480_00070 [Clostridia bacterium]|nr:hypothetical protein [Clostridia bacterium]